MLDHELLYSLLNWKSSCYFYEKIDFVFNPMRKTLKTLSAGKFGVLKIGWSSSLLLGGGRFNYLTNENHLAYVSHFLCEHDGDRLALNSMTIPSKIVNYRV